MHITVPQALVSVNWLYKNFEADNLVILDATIPKVGGEVSTQPNTQIRTARFFDIKKKFSDTAAPFPNTVPSMAQFQDEAQGLGINSDSCIVVYDDKGIYSSARAWYLFKAFGHINVAVLDGGLPEWLNAFNSIIEDKQVHSYKTGDFIAEQQDHYFKFFKDIETLSQTENCTILDARSELRFKGLLSEPRQGLRSGTIPNSKNLPYTELLNGHLMKSKAELQQIFNTISKENTTFTMSCGSGITACILALAAEISGIKSVSVYDGSWTEYGSLTS